MTDGVTHPPLRGMLIGFVISAALWALIGVSL